MSLMEGPATHVITLACYLTLRVSLAVDSSRLDGQLVLGVRCAAGQGQVS